MLDVRVRDLRNDVSRLLRRVQSGERLRVTLRGRPVAVIAPVDSRSPTIQWAAFWAAIDHYPADRRLLDDLSEALPDTTDDVPA